MFGRTNIKRLLARQDVAGLGAALSSEDPEVRREVVIALAAVSRPEAASIAVDLLRRALSDPDERVRLNAEAGLDHPTSRAVRDAIVRRRRGHLGQAPPPAPAPPPGAEAPPPSAKGPPPAPEPAPPTWPQWSR